MKSPKHAQAMNKHTPVLLDVILSFFEKDSIPIFFDGTIGAAGHAKALLSSHREIKKYIGVDRDTKALEIAKENLSAYKDKVHLIHGKFSDMRFFLEEMEIEKVDGILVDVGVSSMQLDEKERGFSFQQDAELDMRMDQSSDITAKKVINTASIKELEMIFRDLAEEPRYKKLAKAINERRKKKKIQTTQELIEVIKPFVKRRKKLHPATLVFQGLRIYVNKELEELEKLIKEGIDLLNEEKKMAVISFHSLEDRIVKNLFREAAKEKKVELLVKKPIVATRDEMRRNPRSRSAKLRIIKKIKAT